MEHLALNSLLLILSIMAVTVLGLWAYMVHIASIISRLIDSVQELSRILQVTINSVERLAEAESNRKGKSASWTGN